MAQNNETVEKTSAREEVLRGNGQGTDNDETASISVRHLMMKVDFRVMPWLVVLFVLSFLDKVNIANGKVFNLAEDLRLQKTEYNTCLVIYFISYVIFDIPMTLLIRVIKPHIYLSICTLLFGLISMCQGFVNSYGELLAARFFLGIAEAGTFSCCFYLIAVWYPRARAQKRFTFFYCSVQFAGAFAGLLASAIGLLDGHRGYSGWRWIFIIEGAFSAAVAIPFFFLLPDFPEQVSWLSAAERASLTARSDRSSSANEPNEPKLDLKVVVGILSEPKVLLGGLMYFALVVPGYSYAYFAPSIIKTYTPSVVRTQLLSVAPWACGLVCAMTLAALSDRLRHRLSFATAPLALAIAGLSVLLSVHDHPSTQYAALFLLVIGIWSSLPVQLCWVGMNVEGQARRAVALGWQVGFGNLGGIVAVYLFLDGDAPRYTPGYATCLGFAVLAAALNGLYAMVCMRENRMQDRRSSSSNHEGANFGPEGGTHRHKDSAFRNVL